MKTKHAMQHSRRGFLQTAGTAAAILALGGLPFAARAAAELRKGLGINP